MNVHEWISGSCAAYAIQSLGTQKDALSAMKTFCKKTLGDGTPSRYGLTKFTPPAAHYIFIAGPEEKGKGHSKEWTAYGTEFAQFILDNNLGEVTTLGPNLNVKHHPDTTCQVWLWHPDPTALEAWWRVILEERKKNPITISKYRASLLPTSTCPNCGYEKRRHDDDFNCPHGGEWPDKADKPEFI